jgi:hypothetical protein
MRIASSVGARPPLKDQFGHEEGDVFTVARPDAGNR